MSMFLRFSAFEEVAEKKLGRDVVQMVRKAMNFTRADLKERFEELSVEIADNEVDYGIFFDSLRGQIRDAQDELSIVCQFSTDPEVKARYQAKIDNLKQRWRDERNEFRQKLQNLRQQARAVREEYMALQA